MKIFQKVTLNYLKRNKVRTFVTILGILLSAAMICAVTTFLSSMNHFARENAIYNTGDWQGGVLSVDWETYDSLSKNSEVTDIVGAQRIGYAEIVQKRYDYKSYYYLLGVKQDFLETMCAHITSGRFPRESYEILLPESFSESGVKLNVGDKLILGTGKRMYYSLELGQDDPFIFNLYSNKSENFSREKTRIYTVVGFYDDLSYKIESAASPGYTTFTYFEEEDYLKEGSLYDVYFNLKDGSRIYDFMEENGLTDGKKIEPVYNWEVLNVSGMMQIGGSKGMSILLIVFVVGLILVGAVALIYNMFSISVSERTKQFGLLSSIGATQKQIRKMVLYESFVVSVIGIPIGIAVGVGGIWLALQFIGDKFQALGYMIPMTIHVSGAAIVGAVVVSLLTVLVSAWIPSERAMKASIIENIKQNKDIYQSKKEGKGLISKVFGVSGMLADCYCKRSKKKYQATLLSLFVSTIMFVLVSFFMNYVLQIVEEGFNKNSFDLAFHYDLNKVTDYTQDEFLDLMAQEEHITDAVYTTSVKSYLVEMDKSYLSEWALANPGTLTRSYRINPDVVTLTINVAFVQDKEYKELLKQYELDEDDFIDYENPKAIVVDGVLNSNTNTNVSLLAGDECKIDFTRSIYEELPQTRVEGIDENGEWITETTYETVYTEKLIYSLEGEKTIYERPYYIDGSDGLLFLYPESLRQYYIGRFPERNEDWGYPPVEKINDFSRLVEDNMCNCKFLSTDANASYEALKIIAEENNLSVANFVNNGEQIAKEQSLLSIIEVLSLGFIVLISLVAAINVFNTVSTNISLRRREFAVLKSVGMTEKLLNRMLFAECTLLSMKSLLYGLPVAFVGTLLIYLFGSTQNDVAYHFPWEFILIAIGGIIVIVFVSMMYITRMRKKENVLEALKNENI